jgi:hypothetical protein
MAGVTKTNLQIGDSGTATNNFTLSVPAVPDGTVKLARGNHGATTQDILTVDASGVVAAPQGSYGGLRLMTAVTCNNTQQLYDFTGIPSWAKRITVMLSGVSVNGTNNILIQIGDAGGIENTGYTSISTNIAGGGNTVINNATGFVIYSTLDAYTQSTAVTLTKVDGNLWLESHSGARTDVVTTIAGGGNKTLSDTLTQVRVTTTGANNFDAGTINILYEG